MYSQEFVPGEPDRLNFQGATKDGMSPQPGDVMCLHECCDVQLSQLYPQCIWQVDGLKSQAVGLSMKGSPAIYCNDATMFPIGYFCSKELQAVPEVVDESPREALHP